MFCFSIKRLLGYKCYVCRCMGLFNKKHYTFSTPSAPSSSHNKLFHLPRLTQPHALVLHHTGSNTLSHPQIVLSLSVLLPVYISHHSGSSTLSHPQIVLSLSVLLPVYVSRLLSVMKLCSVPNFPSCLKPGFYLLSSARANKSYLQ